MNPDVIRLFNREPSAENEPSAQYSEDLDSLERQFQSILQRSSFLRAELRQANQKVAVFQEKLKRAEDRVGALEPLRKELDKARAQAAAVLKWRADAESELKTYQEHARGYYEYARQLARYAESTRATALATNKRNQDLTATLADYRQRLAAIVEREQTMNQALSRARAEFELKINERDAALESLRESRRSDAEKSARRISELNAALNAATKEIQAGRSALALTSNALKTYQAQWKNAFKANEALKKQLNQTQQELERGRELLSSFGPIEDRQILAKQISDQRAEIERLRQQVLAKATVERELAKARQDNDQILAEYLQESERFKAALREKS